MNLAQQAEIGGIFKMIQSNLISTVTNKLHLVINDSMNAGDGISRMATKIQCLYGKMNEHRAARIAKTEARGGAGLYTKIQGGVVEFKDEPPPLHPHARC